jgi:hypothetical protein
MGKVNYIKLISCLKSYISKAGFHSRVYLEPFFVLRWESADKLRLERSELTEYLFSAHLVRAGQLLHFLLIETHYAKIVNQRICFFQIVVKCFFQRSEIK